MSYRQPWEQEMDRGVDAATLRGIMDDNRKSSPLIPSSMLPQKPTAVPKAVSGAQAKGENGWLPEKPLTHEPSYAERQLEHAFPAQGKRGL